MFRLPAGNLIASASALGASCKYLQLGRTATRQNGGPLILDHDQINIIFQAATQLKAASGEMKMVACAAAARDLGDTFQRLPPPTSRGMVLIGRPLDELIAGLEYFLRTFRDEIDARPLFAMPPGKAPLYDQTEPLFGDTVDANFPSSADDVAEAGRCFALGRWTAAVMHLMRALETPLALLAAHVGVDGTVNWNKSLNEIEAKLRAIGKRDHGPAEEQWAAEATSHFRAIKNAWRNHVMHARTFYDEERATEIYEAVRALMRSLAPRLAEA